MKFPKLQIMIDHLKQLDDSPTSKMGFDMNYEYKDAEYAGHSCGSACCIGGHASILLREKDKLDAVMSLSKLCDLPSCSNHSVAYQLCYPSFDLYNGRYSDIDIDKAITVLEHCRDTGEVDWSLVTEVNS